MRTRTITTIAGAAALAALAACGAPAVTRTTSSAPPAAAPYTAPATPAAAPSTPPDTGGVGTTFDVSGTGDNGGAFSYNVTLVRVKENAAPDNSFDAAPSGQHLAGAEFRITGVSGTSSDDANSDAVANGTDEQAYQPSFSGLAAGTNFNSGDFSVSAGQTSIGWVAFQLPDGISVANVQWSPGFGSSTATWTVSA